jgi:hypothetical protein
VTRPPRLLSGGNPQIPKGHGDEVVQAWIAAAPGWKADAAAWIDRLAGEAVPGVVRAVKWNSPLYGLDGATWFMSFHAMTAYLKVAFHRGVDLTPPLPVGSKQPHVRYVHIGEHDRPDEGQMVDWMRQAARLPGERM